MNDCKVSSNLTFGCQMKGTVSDILLFNLFDFFFAGSTRLQISGVFHLLCQRFCFRFVQLCQSLLWSNSIINRRTKRPLFLEKNCASKKNIHSTFLKHRDLERVFLIRKLAFEKACSCVTEKNVFVARSICLNQDSMFKKSATIREPLFQYLNKNVQNNYFFL